MMRRLIAFWPFGPGLAGGVVLVLLASHLSAAEIYHPDQNAVGTPNWALRLAAVGALGQEFTPARSWLDAVQVCTSDDGPPGDGVGAVLVANIRQDRIDGPVVGSSRPLVLPDGFGPSHLGPGAVTLFTFPQPVRVQPGARFVLEIVPLAAGNWLIWGLGGGPGRHDAYRDGALVTEGTPRTGGEDLWFITGDFGSDSSGLPTPCAVARTNLPFDAYAIAASATPSAALPGQAIVVAVWERQGRITSVTVDLTRLGGGAAEPLYNDGTHGDRRAGDQWHSRAVGIGAATPPGLAELPIRVVRDGPDVGLTAAVLVQEPTRPPPLLVDQSSTSMTRTRFDVAPVVTRSGIGQEFRPTLPWLEAVLLRSNDGSVAQTFGGDVAVRIRRDGLDGPTVATSLVTTLPPNFGNPTLVGDLQGEITRFDFAAPVPLVPGMRYVIEPVTVTGSVWPFYGGDDSYPSGGAIGAPEYLGPTDFWFVEGPIAVAPAVVPLPPPTGDAPAPPTATVAVSAARVRPGEPVLLTATVVPGANPTSLWLGVRALTTALDGAAAARQLHDDGTHGDSVAGDRVFSLLVTAAITAGPGDRTVPVVVYDSHRRASSASAAVGVDAPAPVTALTAAGAFEPSPLAAGAPARLQVRLAAPEPIRVASAAVDLSPLGGSASAPLFDGGSACDAVAGDGVFSTCVIVPLELPAGRVDVTGEAFDADGRRAGFTVSAAIAPADDTDGDGLPDAYETAFGLNPHAAVGADGADGDPDLDGVSNAQERAQGTHPRGAFVRYLAEGVINDFYRTRLALLNPTDAPALVLVRLQPEDGPERSLFVTMPARTQRTLLVDDLAALVTGSFATVVESDVEVVVDRMVAWGAGDYENAAETGVRAPATRWLLAEGATGGPFSLFYLLQNPTDHPASVEIAYLRGHAEAVLTRTYIVGPRQRRTIWVDDEELPEGSGNKPLAGGDVSARIEVTNGVPIVVERAMYLSSDDELFAAGHAGAAVPRAATTWRFAEGATGAFFDEFLLLVNPGPTAAPVLATFRPEAGLPVVRTYLVPPASRMTIHVDAIPGLGGTTHTSRIDADEPIVVERAMWWPGDAGGWHGGHVSAGATVASSRWAIADLELHGPHRAQSYVLIANGGTATAYFDDGTPPVVCASSQAARVTVDVNLCPGTANRRIVGMVVDGNPDTVVERATYYSRDGQPFAAGASALAARIR